MKKKVAIELFEEHEALNFFTIVIDGEKNSESYNFFEKYHKPKFKKDLDEIVSVYDKIGENGALERYFRRESSFKYKVFAIPVCNSHLRLYCIRISENLIIIGNGGEKNTQTYNEDPILDKYVKTLKKVSIALQNSLRNNQTQFHNGMLYGKLTFEIANIDNYEKK